MKLAIAIALAGAVGCGNGQPSNTGAAGSGGGSAGAAGIVGIGGSAAGNGGGVAGTAGGDSGTGTGGLQSPQEVHDTLLNAQTTGGIDVTRTAPTVSYPTCQ